jgi:ATP-dependent DNA ligase
LVAARHELDNRVGDLLDACARLSAGTVLDGELVALADHDGCAAQDFATVSRAVPRR